MLIREPQISMVFLRQDPVSNIQTRSETLLFSRRTAMRMDFTAATWLIEPKVFKMTKNKEKGRHMT